MYIILITISTLLVFIQSIYIYIYILGPEIREPSALAFFFQALTSLLTVKVLPPVKPVDPDEEEDTDAVLYRTPDDRVLQILKKRTDTAVAVALHRTRDYKVFTMGLAPMQTYWKLWRRCYHNSRKLAETVVVRMRSKAGELPNWRKRRR